MHPDFSLPLRQGAARKSFEPVAELVEAGEKIEVEHPVPTLLAEPAEACWLSLSI